MNLAKRIFTYLALGDSYTIGEAVSEEQRFPSFVKNAFGERGIELVPTIVAKTGWTTGELIEEINKRKSANEIGRQYDFVSLLVGVNNQYRGQELKQYESEFLTLLKEAIQFAGEHKRHVTVLSIPDWGVTPFASDRDRSEIAREIDLFNSAANSICSKNNINFIDITGLTREATFNPQLLTTDGLHPSGLDYRRWAKKVEAYFLSVM
jgi:lysophospholipase L1-like esterase